jgi:hypothetical protein
VRGRAFFSNNSTTHTHKIKKKLPKNMWREEGDSFQKQHSIPHLSTPDTGKKNSGNSVP